MNQFGETAAQKRPKNFAVPLFLTSSLFTRNIIHLLVDIVYILRIFSSCVYLLLIFNIIIITFFMIINSDTALKQISFIITEKEAPGQE